MSYAQLSKDQQADHAQIQSEIARTGAFVAKYMRQRNAKDDQGVVAGPIACFDSAITVQHGENQGEQNTDLLPSSLHYLFDSVTSEEGRGLIYAVWKSAFKITAITTAAICHPMR